MEEEKRERLRLAVQALADAIREYNRRLDAGLRHAAADYYWNYVEGSIQRLEGMGITVNTPNPLDVGITRMSAQMQVSF